MTQAQALTDNFEALKKIITDADFYCDLRKQLHFLHEKEDSVKKKFLSLQTVHKGIILRIFSRDFSSLHTSLISLQPSEDVCHELKENESEITEKLAAFDFYRAEKLYQH
ncbi:MAG: hypothetical protein DRI57_29355, partial [Deltaproteobacteria bacterium]